MFLLRWIRCHQLSSLTNLKHFVGRRSHIFVIREIIVLIFTWHRLITFSILTNRNRIPPAMPPPMGRQIIPSPQPETQSNVKQYKSIIENVEEGVAGMRRLLVHHRLPIKPSISSSSVAHASSQQPKHGPGGPYIETGTVLSGKSDIHIPHHLSVDFSLPTATGGMRIRNPVSDELNWAALDGNTWDSPSLLSIGEPGFEHEQANIRRKKLLESIDNALLAAARGEDDDDEDDDEETILMRQTLSSVKSAGRHSPVFGKQQYRSGNASNILAQPDVNISAIWMVATLKRLRRKHFTAFWSRLQAVGEVESRQKATLQMRQLARPLLICQAKSSALALGHGIRTKILAQMRNGLRALDENIAYQVVAHAQMEHDDFAEVMEKKRYES
jgi:hypothetical protein